MSGPDDTEGIEHRTGLIASMAPFPIGVTRVADGALVYVNQAFADLMGTEPETLIGKPAPDFYADPDDRAAMLMQLRERGELRNHEIRARRPDGEERQVLVNLTFIELDSDVCVMATVLDITERALMQRALEEERLRLTRMVDIAGDAIISVDSSYSIVLYNRAAEEMFGYSAEETLGQSLGMLIPSQHRSAHREHMHEFAGAGEASRRMGLRSEVTGVRRNGEVFPVGASISKLERGKTAVYTAIVRDLSAQKAVADALEQSRAQLRQSQKMEALGRLAGGVAHDFNNLLTAILGNAELVLRGTFDPDEVRQDVAEIQLAAERAARLTQQLLAFGRKQTLRPRVVELRQIVDGVENMLRRVIGEHIELVRTPADVPVHIEVDPGQIEQVLVNLVINAAQAMSPRGRLTVSTQRRTLKESRVVTHGVLEPGLWATLTVSDTGTGMDEHTLQLIFEPFFTTKPIGSGSGLGLSTVLGIVKQSGGAIEVSSVRGEGSTFRIWLPSHDGAPDEVEAPERKAPQRGAGESVLLVEDNPMVRSLALRLITDLGYAVTEAPGGEEGLALARARAEPFDLLLTDVVMPGMTGNEIAVELCRMFPETKVVFMTGYVDTQLESLGGLGDDVRVLQKPFTRDELAKALREALDS